jgi:hypothetical protein
METETKTKANTKKYQKRGVEWNAYCRIIKNSEKGLITEDEKTELIKTLAILRISRSYEKSLEKKLELSEQMDKLARMRGCNKKLPNELIELNNQKNALDKTT